MKKLIGILICCALSAPLFATVWTVSNAPTTIAQFSDIQAACEASSSGDVIYVSGSPTDYKTFTVNNKKLTIIGPGWSPNKEFALRATVPGCNLTGAGAAGSELQGLTFTGTVSMSTIGVDNIRFIRNRFFRISIQITPNTPGNITGYMFEGNWFDSSFISTNASYTLSNFLFINNVFYDNNYGISVSGFKNALFDHNIWYGDQRDLACFRDCSFLLLTNNIFINRDPASGIGFSNFTNNITYQTTNTTPWTGNDNIDNGGNLAGVDPMIVDIARIINGESNLLLDFTITGGQAKGGAADGKDIGLLFDPQGSLNWARSRGSQLPYISKMNITTPTVQTGSNISVKIEAKSN